MPCLAISLSQECGHIALPCHIQCSPPEWGCVVHVVLHCIALNSYRIQQIVWAKHMCLKRSYTADTLRELF